MIPGVGKLSSYTVDILLRLSKKQKVSNGVVDYLETVQEGNITEEHREKLLSWIFNTGDALGVTTYTKELSGGIIDAFLKTTPVRKSILQLIGICSLQIAIKVNESFIVDLNTLSELCGNQYSLSTILQFEEILLEKINWNPYQATSGEILSHLKSLFNEVAAESKLSESNHFESLNSLSEIFNSPEYASKVAIFTQIAILDYDLSRFGPLNLAIVAILGVLKSKDRLAEYYSFLELVFSIFDDNGFEAQLLQACKVATRLFGIHLDLDLTYLVEDTKEAQPENVQEENDEEDEVWKELNHSLTSDTSQSTIGRSSTTSPFPSSHKIKLANSKAKTGDAEFVSPEDKRKQIMFRKKRRIIGKRNLN